MSRLPVLLSCLALAACGAAPGQPLRTAAPGTEITLEAGAAVAVPAANLNVQFVDVLEDSRCPLDTTCVWAGEVKVRLAIQRVSQAATMVVVAEGGSVPAGEHRVTLVRVEPRPASTARIAPREYRATLKVD